MQTGLEIINEVERRIGRRVTSSLEGASGERSEVKQMTTLLNRILLNLTPMQDWPMLNEDGTLLTQAPITGTDVRFDLTNGSDTVSISSFDVSDGGSQATPFLLDHKLWAFQIGTGTPVYRIVETLSPTSVRLNRPWIGTTNAPTGASTDTLYDFTMAMDQYALPEDFSRPIEEWTDFLSEYDIMPKSPSKFRDERRKERTTISTGDPLYFTIYGLDPNQTYQVIHFHPFPDKQTMMQFGYIKKHPKIQTDIDLILFPETQVGVIIEAMIYFSDRDYEDDTRANMAMQEYLNQYNQTAGASTIVSEVMSFAPKARRMRSVRSLGTLRVDYGDFWDRYDKGKLP